MAGEEVFGRDHALAPRRRLEVPDVRERRDDVALAREHRVEAERDVAAAQHKALVEPAEPLEQLAPHRDTGPGDREHVAVPRRRAEERGRVGTHALEQVVGKPVHAEHDAAVLDLTVRPDELRTDQPDVGTDGPAHHFAHPSRVGHLGVVVEEHEHLAACECGAGVVHRRVVERLLGPPLHLEIEPRERVPVPLLVVVGALAVVDDDDVEARVVGAEEPAQAPAHERPVVASGDDHRDVRRSVQLPPRAHRAPFVRDRRGLLPAVEVSLNELRGNVARWVVAGAARA